MERTLEIAGLIASYPQGSIRTDKEGGYQGVIRPLEDGVRLENPLFWSVVLDKDFFEGMRAFKEKRASRYTLHGRRKTGMSSKMTD